MEPNENNPKRGICVKDGILCPFNGQVVECESELGERKFRNRPINEELDCGIGRRFGRRFGMGRGPARRFRNRF